MRKLLGATVLSVALVVGITGAPAQAAKSTTVTDNPNDAYRGIDMRKVKIAKVGSVIKVRTVFSHIGRNLNGMQYYFDTKKSRKGPEYGAIFYRAKDGDRVTGVHVYRARSWTKPGKELTCMTKSRWKINPNGTGTFTAWFGPGCLEFHGNKRLRASVRSWDYTKYVGQGEARRGSYGHTDVMRAKRSFSRWVR